MMQIRTAKGNDFLPHKQEDHTFLKSYPNSIDPWIRPETHHHNTSQTEFSAAQTHSWMPDGVIEFSEGWFYLESPHPDDDSTANDLVLTGWCLPRPGSIVNELRLKVGHQIHILTYGHPRPDLATLIGDACAFLPVGFDRELTLPTGRNRLTFDALTENPEWLPIGDLELNVNCRRQSTPSSLSSRVSPTQFAEGMEILLDPVANGNPKQRAATLIRSPVWHNPVRYPALPFHGYVDKPTGIVRPIYGGTVSPDLGGTRKWTVAHGIRAEMFFESFRNNPAYS